MFQDPKGMEVKEAMRLPVYDLAEWLEGKKLSNTLNLTREQEADDIFPDLIGYTLNAINGEFLVTRNKQEIRDDTARRCYQELLDYSVTIGLNFVYVVDCILLFSTSVISDEQREILSGEDVLFPEKCSDKEEMNTMREVVYQIVRRMEKDVQACGNLSDKE